MKSKILSVLFVFLLSSPTIGFGSGYQFVDRIFPGGSSGAFGIASGKNGFNIAVGSGGNTPAESRGLVRMSHDSGRTWKTADIFQAGNLITALRTVAIKNNEIYVGGTVIEGQNRSYYVMRKSNDYGVHWSTVDKLSHGADTFGYKVAIGPHFEVYSLITFLNSDGQQGGILRASFDRGRTWRTLGVYENRALTGIIVDRFGQVYVTGGMDFKNGTGGLFVVKSIDRGLTWQEIDRALSPVGRGGAINIYQDRQGNLFTTGNLWDKNKIRFAFTRGSFDGGRIWRFLDRFRLSDKANSETYNIVEYGRGHYMTGGYSVVDAKNHWVFRKTTDYGKTWSIAAIIVGENGLGGKSHSMTIDDRGSILGAGFVGNLDLSIRQWAIVRVYP